MVYGTVVLYIGFIYWFTLLRYVVNWLKDFFILAEDAGGKHRKDYNGNQGLCLGALFDIAATNVRNFHAFNFLINLRFQS